MIDLSFLYPWFKVDQLNGFVVLAIAMFLVLTIVYSLGFMKRRREILQYYIYVVITAVVSIAAVLANDLRLLLGLWGFLGLTLYLLINMGDNESTAVAKKTFIIVGGTDALMLLGIGILHYLTGTFQMDKINISLANNSLLPVVAYLCIAVACFAKAGAMPFHSWIPDCAQSAPLPVVAYLPASLDKLLGIYLLARISLNLFVMVPAVNMLLMLIGAFTIIAAVMMALIQHNMKRLLGYHAVSQVGYMVLGIGTGLPIGIAGGIFHMLNHAIYKACLFFGAGNVEYREKTSELDKLGGFARIMPITYISCFVASLSISGVPPFNGFVSKWMIYQGLIAGLKNQNNQFSILTILCLTAAMFGSGLTLASFMKLLHAAFLGPYKSGQRQKQEQEVPWLMWLPCVVLALLCVLFGVFAYAIPLKYFIFPAVAGVTTIGLWESGLATALVILGLIIGMIVFNLKAIKPAIREDLSFVGAETAEAAQNQVTGTEFYNTVKDLEPLKDIYAKAQKGKFDIYEQSKALVFGIGRFLQYLHNGVLPTYIVWTLLGMIVLFFVLVK